MSCPVARKYHQAHDPFMRVVVTSNNMVRLSFLTALLADAGIEAVLLDGHTSVLEGSAGAIPRRLVVSADDFPAACRILRDAGEL
jgi:Putative prokaryotic signal transducing protein